MIGRTRLAGSASCGGAFAPPVGFWPPSGWAQQPLGQEATLLSSVVSLAEGPALVIFSRESNPADRHTMREWQDGLQNGTIKPDKVIGGVRRVSVIAQGGDKTGQNLIMPEKFYDSALANDIFRYGGNIAHPTRGALWIPPWIFSNNKSLDQMIQERDAPVTLSCRVGDLKGSVSGWDMRKFTDEQARGFAGSANKTIACNGIGGDRNGRDWKVNPDGSISAELPWKANAVFCPAGTVGEERWLRVRQGDPNPSEGEVVTTAAKATDWAGKTENQCNRLSCRDANTGQPRVFYNCPPGREPPPGGDGADRGGGIKLAGMGLGTIGIIGAVVAVIAAVAFRQKSEAAPPAAAEGFSW